MQEKTFTLLKLSPMTNQIQTYDTVIDAVRRRLQVFNTDELQESLILNRRITPPPDCPAEVRRDHELRQELMLAILNARRAAVPVKGPICSTAEDYAAGKRTMCQHVEGNLPDGSNVRFHCRVVVPDDSPAETPQANNAPGLLARVWHRLFPS